MLGDRPLPGGEPLLGGRPGGRLHCAMLVCCQAIELVLKLNVYLRLVLSRRLLLQGLVNKMVGMRLRSGVELEEKKFGG
jgi:hypothetical protein